MDPVQTIEKEPLFNVPPVTLGLAVVLLGIQLLAALLPSADAFLQTLVYVPSLVQLDPLHEGYRLFSYGLLHGGWLHLGINMLGLFAFGSAVERRFGALWLFTLLAGGTLAGAMVYLPLHDNGDVAMVGISAGLSALLGAILPLLVPQGKMLWRTIAVFLGTMVLLGFLGMPGQDDAQIAWQAHLAGFVIGLPFGLWQRGKIKKERPHD